LKKNENKEKEEIPFKYTNTFNDEVENNNNIINENENNNNNIYNNNNSFLSSKTLGKKNKKNNSISKFMLQRKKSHHPVSSFKQFTELHKELFDFEPKFKFYINDENINNHINHNNNPINNLNSFANKSNISNSNNIYQKEKELMCSNISFLSDIKIYNDNENNNLSSNINSNINNSKVNNINNVNSYKLNSPSNKNLKINNNNHNSHSPNKFDYRRKSIDSKISFYSVASNNLVENDNLIRGNYNNKKQKNKKYIGLYNKEKEREGFGIIKWMDNSILIGKFIKNKLEGCAKFYDVIDNNCFYGYYINNEPNGYILIFI